MAKGKLMKAIAMIGLSIALLASNAYAEKGDWRIATGLGSMYLDSEKHGYDDSGLDTYAVDVQVMYSFSSLLDFSAGYMHGVGGLAERAGQPIEASMLYLDTHWKLSDGTIKPYFVLGAGLVDVSPEAGKQTPSVRGGFGVMHQLNDDLDINFSYVASSASVEDAGMESMTTLGVVYTFR